MAIDGVSGGGYVPTLPPGTSGAGPVSGTNLPQQLEGSQLEQLHTQLQALLKGNNPAADLDAPGELDPQAASNAASGLGKLDTDQVSADIYTFMALFQKLAQTMRDTARSQRDSEMRAQVASLQAAADQMRTAAGLRFANAIATGVGQMVGGMMQAGMAGASYNSPNQQAMVSEGQAYSQISSSVGSMIGATFNLAADFADAKKTDLETQAKIHETASQHANDLMQQMMDIIRDVRDKLGSIQQAAIETNRGIARNI